MDDLKLIKKYYGEEMMHHCREMFPAILETEGLLYEIISENYAHSRFLWDDIVSNSQTANFRDFICTLALAKTNKVEEKAKTNKTPFELMDERGYTLYECKSEKDIQSFRHYYHRRIPMPVLGYIEGTIPLPASGEELCTFNGGRLNSHHVFFAVKKNVDEIKRAKKGEEQRQDEYGTSVISIQFARGNYNSLSIKNRYNHTVDHCDATFSNNLENIIPGLTEAFEQAYGFKIKQEEGRCELPGYVIANDGKRYKYNYEINNIHYCPNNIIIDNGEVKHFDTSRYIIFEHYIIDMQEKTIKAYESNREKDGPFHNRQYNKIQVINIKDKKEKKIIIDGSTEIILNDKSQLIRFSDPSIKVVGDDFLSGNIVLEEIDLPNVEEIGDGFLEKNISLRKINVPKVRKIGRCFLAANQGVEEIELPEVEEIKSNFFDRNRRIKNISLPKCKKIGSFFLQNNEKISSVYLPKVEEIGIDFLSDNESLVEIDLPKLKEVRKYFIYRNKTIRKVNLPNVEKIASYFLQNNKELETIDLSNVKKIEDCCLQKNKKIRKINLPKVKEIGLMFLTENQSLEEIELPELIDLGGGFLTDNKIIKRIEVPNISEGGFKNLNLHHRLKTKTKLNIVSYRIIDLIANLLDKGKQLTLVGTKSIEIDEEQDKKTK